MIEFPDCGPWIAVQKFTPAAARLTDGHYSRRKVGSPQFMPPGQTLVLMTADELAVFGWWRPHPESGLQAMNGLDGWTCTIFRNTGPRLSSELILEAERELLARYDCGPDGLLTYVWDRKIKSVNPGYCFKVAGWKAIGRSADGRKTLLQKPISYCGGAGSLDAKALAKPQTTVAVGVSAHLQSADRRGASNRRSPNPHVPERQLLWDSGSEIGSETHESTLPTHESHNTAGIGTGDSERA